MAVIHMIYNVPLISQDQSLACWYACAQMLIQWRRESRRMTEAGMRDPSEVRSTAAIHRANHGVSYAENVRLA